MKIENTTPFPIFVYESVDEQDQPIHVVILRGTYDITKENEIAISESQSDIVFSDVYREKPLTSSVAVDTDLVPKKLGSDITFNSVAVPPRGIPTREWRVDVQVGCLKKSIQVCGPRQWKYGYIQGWKLTEPEPTDYVPIHYELAFGGTANRSNEVVTYPSNPVGIGYFDPNHTSLQALVPGPQIWDLEEPILTPNVSYTPVGLGPIAKHWMPRIKLCGTADNAWQKNRWPLRPQDFDFRYYNSAPPGLVYPGFLRGDETVRLSGISKYGEQIFNLPSVFPLIIRHGNVPSVQALSMTLDTLHCDTKVQQVYLTWRTTLLKVIGVPEINVSLQSLSAKSTKVFLS